MVVSLPRWSRPETAVSRGACSSGLMACARELRDSGFTAKSPAPKVLNDNDRSKRICSGVQPDGGTLIADTVLHGESHIKFDPRQRFHKRFGVSPHLLPKSLFNLDLDGGFLDKFQVEFHVSKIASYREFQCSTRNIFDH